MLTLRMDLFMLTSECCVGDKPHPARLATVLSFCPVAKYAHTNIGALSEPHERGTVDFETACEAGGEEGRRSMRGRIGLREDEIGQLRDQECEGCKVVNECFF